MTKKLRKRSNKQETIDCYGDNDPLLSLLKPIYKLQGVWEMIVQRDEELKKNIRNKEVNKKRRYKNI